MNITWYNAPGVEDTPDWLQHIYNIKSNKNILWINYRTIDQRFMVEYTTLTLQTAQNSDEKYDKIVMYIGSEAPDWQYCVNVAVAFGYTDIATIDGSFVSKVQPGPHSELLGKIKYQHLTNPFFLNCYHPSWEDDSQLLPETREHKLVYLARIARPHRVTLAVELLERNLVEETVLSCGWVNWDYAIFSKYIPEKYKRMFPIVLSEESHIEHTSNLTNWGVNPKIRASVFNLIAESGFDHIPTDNTLQYWHKSLVTEKTIKAYILRQFPIWLAPYGAVQEQRDLGFDVFDDIIDHSYDNEYRPYHRLEMVAKEVERLYNRYSIEEMRTLLSDRWDRLERNVEHYKGMTPDVYLKEFLNWAKGDE